MLGASEAETSLVAEPRFRWRFLVVPGLISLVTMPLTAIWFVLLGALTAMTATIAGLVARGRRGQQLALDGVAMAVGIYLGPVVYIGLALLN
jgi:hypothetical protein